LKDGLKNVLVLTSIVIGVAVTLLGLSQMTWSTSSPFTWGPIYRDAVFISILLGALALVAISRTFTVNRFIAGGGLALLIAVVTGNIWSFLVVLWFALASYATGRGILALLKIDKAQIPGITTTLVGAAAYGTAVGLAAHFPINYAGVYGLALAAPVVLGWRSVYDAIHSIKLQLYHTSESKWFDLGIAVIALVHFAVALMPEVGHDALAMHLFIPGHLATRHEWGFDVKTYVWAVMPMMGDWIFAIGYMLAGEVAARLINVGFIFVLAWLVRDLVIWAGGTAQGGRWAVLLFLTTPLTFTESSSLFIESVWATFVVAGSLSVFQLIQTGGNKAAHLPVSGLLLGTALAAKAVTLTILPVLLLLLLLRYRYWAQRSLLTAITLGLILFLAMGAIPYITAWHLTGNPVFPFFNQFFKSPFWPAVAFEAPAVFSEGLTWDVIYQATFHTERFLESRPGASGFIWLLLLFPALLILYFSRRRRGVILIFVAVLCIALTFQSISYLRYVFPSFAWGAAGVGVALSTVQMNAGFLRKVLYIVGWAAVFLNVLFFRSGTNYGDLSLHPMLSQSGRENYLSNRLPIRNAVDLVNQLNTSRTPVAVFASPLTAGLGSDGLYPNWYNHQFQEKVKVAATSDQVAQLLMENVVYYIILDSNWGTAEKRMIIEGATEIINTQGAVAVRRLKRSLYFQTELLKNSDFSSYEGWTLPSNMHPEQQAGSISVSVGAPASQSVSITGGRRYQNSVTALCKVQPTQGRVQVNWLDSRSAFISTDIQLFDCTPTATTRTMEIAAPLNAITAVVYATGHTSIPITISEVSFKQ